MSLKLVIVQGSGRGISMLRAYGKMRGKFFKIAMQNGKKNIQNMKILVKIVRMVY